MAVNYDEAPNGGIPGLTPNWRAVAFIGVPGIVTLGLVWVLAARIDATVAQTHDVTRATATELRLHREEQARLLTDILRVHRQTCRFVAPDLQSMRFCD